MRSEYLRIMTQMMPDAQQREFRALHRQISRLKSEKMRAHDNMIAAITRCRDAHLRAKSAEGSLRAIGRDLADYAKELDESPTTADLNWLIEHHRSLRKAFINLVGERDRLWIELNGPDTIP